jgi:UDP-N-acetylmuramoyl-L-alanyl-D-glutamate--2,6-diaminopimelate ligase
MLSQIISKAKGVSTDSRKLQPDEVFVALKGADFDGNNFIADILKLSNYIVTDRGDIIHKYNNHPNIILVADAAQALNDLIEKLYNKRPKHLMAVTGTNGKSSIVGYIRQIGYLLNHNTASIGTLGLHKNDNIDITECLTTPDKASLYKTLHQLATDGYDYVAIEASAHGLTQNRLEGLKFNAAGFSSFSQDHLDYYKDMQSYFASKKKLFFSNIMQNGFAIINEQILQYDAYFLADLNQQDMFNTLVIGQDIKIISAKATIHGQEVNFLYNGQVLSFTTQLISRHQLENLLMAMMLLNSCGVDMMNILSVVSRVKSIAGRMARVHSSDNYNIFIDYAHSPDALKTVLLELRSISTKRLILLMGCGGNRDVSKRKIIGEIASKYADIFIATDDNPRFEEPALIRKHIMEGAISAIEIEGRAAAIEYALSLLQEGDTLLIAGKGHENYQIIQNTKFYFNDKEMVEKWLSNHK